MKAFEFAATQPWAMLPAMLETICSITLPENNVEAVVAKLGRPLENTDKTQIRDSVAIIPVTGPVMRYANLFSNVSGATSIEVLATDFTQALQNPNVNAIVLDIDSPGGTVAGVNELAQMIFDARGQKPIVAYVSGLGASAAYWIASAADEIILDATASVGSIGVVSVQTDDSERKARNGIKDIQIVSSVSPRKRPDLNTDDGRAQVQALVDSLAEVFVNSVARNRNVTSDTVLSDFGAGGLLVGVDAVKVGLADRIGSLEQLIMQFSSTSSLSNPKGVFMSDTIPLTPDTLTPQWLNDHQVLVDHFHAQGAAFERERIKSVEAQVIPGHEGLIHTLKFDGHTTGEQAAVQILSAEKQLRCDRLTQLKADAPAPVPMPAVETVSKPAPIADADLPDDERYEAMWRNDSKVRQEFGTKETFMAYMTAQRNGQVRILSQQEAA